MIVESKNAQVKWLVDFILLPIFCYVLSLKAWLWLFEPTSANEPILSIIFIVVLLAISYDVGFKHYYRKSRRVYFLSIFVVPLLISIIGMVGSYSA